MIDLYKGESILATHRRHWFAIAVEGVSLGGLALFPLAALVVGLFIEGAREFLLSHLAAILFFTSAWMLFLWAVFFILWTNYYLNSMIVTNVRVIDVQQNSLFSREVADVRLDNVQDVKVEVHGIIATWLNFGNVHVQSAGASREIISHKKNEPYKLRDAILKAQHEKLGHRYGYPDSGNPQQHNTHNTHQQHNQHPPQQQHGAHHDHPQRGTHNPHQPPHDTHHDHNNPNKH